MKTIVLIALFAAVAVAQGPLPMRSPPCPTGITQAKCDKFYACMPKPSGPPPPQQGTQGTMMQTRPTPSPTEKARMDAAEQDCFTKAGMNSAEQTIMKANRPKPGQRPPPSNNSSAPATSG